MWLVQQGENLSDLITEFKLLNSTKARLGLYERQTVWKRNQREFLGKLL